jgi:hypothetical protein
MFGANNPERRFLPLAIFEATGASRCTFWTVVTNTFNAGTEVIGLWVEEMGF